MEFGDKIAGEIKVQHKVTEEDIEAIICTAFEGGINSWAELEMDKQWIARTKGTSISEWATKILLEGGQLKFNDVARTEDDSCWILKLGDVMEGLEMEISKHDTDLDAGNWDADICDRIIQYGLFGEIVFG